MSYCMLFATSRMLMSARLFAMKRPWESAEKSHADAWKTKYESDVILQSMMV